MPMSLGITIDNDSKVTRIISLSLSLNSPRFLRKASSFDSCVGDGLPIGVNDLSQERKRLGLDAWAIFFSQRCGRLVGGRYCCRQVPNKWTYKKRDNDRCNDGEPPAGEPKRFSQWLAKQSCHALTKFGGRTARRSQRGYLCNLFSIIGVG